MLFSYSSIVALAAFYIKLALTALSDYVLLEGVISFPDDSPCSARPANAVFPAQSPLVFS